MLSQGDENIASGREGVPQSLSELKALRATTKGSLTRIRQFVSSKGQALSLPELECRLGILESYFKQILNTQIQIERLSSQADADSNMKSRNEIEDIYIESKSLILMQTSKLKAALPPENLNASFAIQAPVSRSNLQCQKIPKFSGKYTEYPNFMGIFKKLVHNNLALDSLEKFNYLMESVEGPALAAIKEFEVNETNYSKAMNRLQERFDNKNLMLQEHVRALFNLPKVSRGSSSQLRSLVDSVNTHFSAMLSIGTFENIANALLLHLVCEKLDTDSMVKWEEAIDYSKLSSWELCEGVLSRRCQNLEVRESKLASLSSTCASLSQAHNTSRRNRPKYSGNHHTTLVASNVSCNHCNKSGHTIDCCLDFKALNVADRFTFVKKKMLCINCLAIGHSVRRCSSTKCQVCGGPHHMLLHRYENKAPAYEDARAEPEEEKPVSSSLHSSSVVEADRGRDPAQVILATAVIKLEDGFGQFFEVRALLDSASQLNFVTESLVQKLRLRKTRVDTKIAGVGKSQLDVKYSTNIAISSRLTNFSTTTEALVLSKITSVQPEQMIDIADWSIPKNLELADPNFHVPSSVDLLIGADLFYSLLSVGQIKLGEQRPVLQKTLFGWVVSGKVQTNHMHLSKCHIVAEVQGDSLLNELVERFWRIESIPSVPILSEEEQLCEKHFTNTVARTVEGRFVVRLPFKDNYKGLGESVRCAERRFYSLERRLGRNMELRDQYANFIKEYIDMGHMMRVPKVHHPLVKYVAPHQCVMKPDSTSTKLRVVFDCSSRTSTNMSLNDVLLKGPVVQDELFSIILRFRCYKYVLTADISKMYRQIWIDERDSFHQCILWRDDPSQVLEIYKLLTVTYGTSSAPFLATRCLKYLAETNYEMHPLGATKVLHDFYVDDLITGADSSEEIEEIYRDVKELLALAKFDIRKWYSNEPTFLATVPEEDREKPLRINDADIIKALGIVWDPNSDEFCYVDPKLGSSTHVTMRIVLSEMAQLFDPLGLISPIIVSAKIFLQDLWISKVKWDESLSQDLHTQWSRFKDQLADLNKIKVKRCVISNEKDANFQIHGFADASGRAYGCCVYVRSIIKGKVEVRLYSAKSRVAPRKVQPIPKLELCAAELLVQLVNKCLKNFPRKVESVYLWTDSEIVLHWLNKHPSTWETFVANRVSRIQQGSHQATWRHVGSKSNPADIVSRGATVTELLQSCWFTGPQFLYKQEEQWPQTKCILNAKEVPAARKVQVSLLSLALDGDFETEYTKFSGFEKTIRIFCYVRRFINRCRQNEDDRGDVLSVEERDATLLKLVWHVQQIAFGGEIRCLQANKKVPKHSKLKALAPYLDSDGEGGLLRVGGRLKNSDLPLDTKHPILLPKNNKFVQRYVKYLHVKHFHAGPQALVASIRQRFWVINCRALALYVVKQCVHCFKYRPRLRSEVMGNLPRNRVLLTRPFLITGVDFCGPLHVTEGVRGRPARKFYVAVFVCFGCKAVHLEAVGDLSSKAFIMALKRFVARRGLPQRIYCDNATNFVGARRELEELKREFFNQRTKGDIETWCAAEGIDFKHIPPRAPHFGGLWEAAVKSFKYHFRRVMSDNVFNVEEFNTCIIQIESILNSRPLTAMSADPNDYEVLTPGHFLIGDAQRAIPEPILEEPKSITAIERWKRISLVRQHFWDRWRKDYLLEMQSRAKWREAAPKPLQPDVLVLVSDDNTPSNQWLMGRVIRCIQGGDGKVRVVDVRTHNGIIRRPIHRLAVLPIED